MYRNQYDTDVTTFSPEGRLRQVEYAMEAVNQGSCCVGLTSDSHAVLAVLKRSPDELASYQEKIFKIDDHMAIAISGLTADARYLSKHMRTECLNHRFAYSRPLQTGRLVRQLADMHQRCTQDMSYERGRPFGVGLLVIGSDQTGPHLFQTCPSGNYYEYRAQAIGARSQSAKTYLEKHFENLPGVPLDELLVHGVKALEGASGEKDLDGDNTGLAHVGPDGNFKMLSKDEVLAVLASAGLSGDNDAPAASEDVAMEEA